MQAVVVPGSGNISGNSAQLESLVTTAKKRSHQALTKSAAAFHKIETLQNLLIFYFKLV